MNRTPINMPLLWSCVSLGIVVSSFFRRISHDAPTALCLLPDQDSFLPREAALIKRYPMPDSVTINSGAEAFSSSFSRK